MEPSRIEIVGLEKRFGATRALAGASLAVRSGAIHGLVGENGAGKSTLIKCLAGLHRPDAGTIAVDGQPMRFAGPQDAARRGLSFVHQELSLVPYFDAAENIHLGRPLPKRFGCVDRAAMRRAVTRVVADIAPDLPLGRPVKHMTVGERQLVEIARALMGEARVIVLDEPTAALGAEEAFRLHAIVRRLAAAGTAVLYVSHRLGDVLSLCSRLTVLRDGATVFDGAAAGLDRDALVAFMSGGQRGGTAPRSAPRVEQPGSAALSVRGLRLRPDRPAIELAVAAGEIVGLYGLVGAGRSRLLKTLWGARRSDRGDIRIDGRRLPPGSIRAALRAGLAFVPEERRSEGLVLTRSVAANLTLPHLRTFRVTGWLPWPSRSNEWRFAAEIGRRLAIRFARPGQAVGDLSGGNQQKVLVGRWLRRPPTVLLLDEPTRGVDVRAKADLHAALRDLSSSGTAILFATSDLDELLGLADRILVMSDGSIAGALADDRRTAPAVLSLLFQQDGSRAA